MSVERLTRMDDEELGRALHALEPMLVAPTAPDVRAPVAEAIRSGRRPRRHLSSRVRVAILVAAALLLLATAAVAARFVIDLGGIRIEPPPTGIPSASHPPLTGPAFGEPIALAQAADEAGFRPIVPAALGRPDRVWISRGIEQGSVMIAMAWFPREDLPRIPGTPYGASLIEVDGSADLVAKFVRARSVHPSDGAYWIRVPHDLELLTGDGARTFRVTGHTLIWQRGDLALRLETNLSKRAALAVAGLPA